MSYYILYNKRKGGIMAIPKTKEELLTAANDNMKKMMTLISELSENELNTAFDFSKDEKKKEAHWKRDKNIRDIFIHLYEWHQLALKWINANTNGIEKPFFPEPYTFKTYGDFNVKLWEKHQTTSYDTSKKLLEDSHNEIMKVIDSFSDEELFTKKYFSFTGTTSLGSYLISSTSSHYDWAVKKIKAHKKNCKNK